ncbi:MAG: hypothetical protein OXK80_04980 [Bdellovibrionales bacterium]|nr:hypothetical protein [Bdellovibrionales bacterium]
MVYLRILLISFLVVACGKLGDRSRRPDLRDTDRFDRFDRLDRSDEKVDYCYNFSTCRNVCNRIYTHPAERGRCLDLSVYEVEGVHTVAYRLQQPVIRDLRRINEDSFGLFIAVGTETFNQYVYNYTIPEAKRVLAWLAEERDIAKYIFSLGPEEYRNIFLNLMQSVDPIVLEYAFHTSLKRGRDFYQISNAQNNDYAVYMAHQVIANDLCHIRHQYPFFSVHDFNETCMLRVYCHEVGGMYIHRDDFSFISHVMKNANFFDYISEEDPNYGLGIDTDRITPLVCDRVCSRDNSCR